jgi:hypothetical protein
MNISTSHDAVPATFFTPYAIDRWDAFLFQMAAAIGGDNDEDVQELEQVFCETFEEAVATVWIAGDGDRASADDFVLASLETVVTEAIEQRRHATTAATAAAE